MQLEIPFEKDNQLEIDFNKRLWKVVHVKEIVELVLCNCKECENPCQCFIPKSEQWKN